MSTFQTEASGVQELIERLRKAGVEEGQTRGEELLNEARHKADQLLKQAHQQAAEIVAEARREADRLREAGHDAIRLAARDAVIALKAQLADQFRRRVERLVSQTLDDREFLRRLILELARQALPEEEDGEIRVLLPADVGDIQQLLNDPQQVAEEPLSRFVLSVAGELLREGLTFGPGEHHAPGIRVQLVEKDIEIDLTDKAITELLLKHLLPRFRLLVEGHV